MDPNKFNRFNGDNQAAEQEKNTVYPSYRGGMAERMKRIVMSDMAKKETQTDTSTEVPVAETPVVEAPVTETPKVELPEPEVFMVKVPEAEVQSDGERGNFLSADQDIDNTAGRLVSNREMSQIDDMLNNPPRRERAENKVASVDEDDWESDFGSENLNRKAGLVQDILAKIRKTGVGRAFVKTVLVAAVVASASGVLSGFVNSNDVTRSMAIDSNAKTAQEYLDSNYSASSAESESAASEQSAETKGHLNYEYYNYGSSSAKSESLEETSEQEAERHESYTYMESVKFVDGETMNLDLKAGGDNTGNDYLNNAGKEEGRPASFTDIDERLRGQQGSLYEAAQVAMGQGNPEPMRELKRISLESMANRSENLAPLGFNAYIYGVIEADMAAINPAEISDKIQLMEKSEEAYNLFRKGMAEERERQQAEGKIYELINYKDTFSSFYATSKAEMDGQVNLSIAFDEQVAPLEGGTLIMREYTSDYQDWYEAHPEVKERILRAAGQIGYDFSAEEINEVMSEWQILGQEVGCGQYALKKRVKIVRERSSGGGGGGAVRRGGGGGGGRSSGGGGGGSSSRQASSVNVTYVINQGGGEKKTEQNTEKQEENVRYETRYVVNNNTEDNSDRSRTSYNYYSQVINHENNGGKKDEIVNVNRIVNENEIVNKNKSANENEIVNKNKNANDNENENVNKNKNANDNENENVNKNKNDNENENLNKNKNANDNENENANKNKNDNENANKNKNDNENENKNKNQNEEGGGKKEEEKKLAPKTGNVPGANDGTEVQAGTAKQETVKPVDEQTGPATGQNSAGEVMNPGAAGAQMGESNVLNQESGEAEAGTSGEAAATANGVEDKNVENIGNPQLDVAPEPTPEDASPSNPNSIGDDFTADDWDFSNYN